MRGGGRPDENQGTIVGCLRRAGYSVHITSGVGGGFPDLVVGGHGVNLLMEVKTAKGKERSKQTDFRVGWKGRTCTVRSMADALKAAQHYLRKD